jgi:hypothetical protein
VFGATNQGSVLPEILCERLTGMTDPLITEDPNPEYSAFDGVPVAVPGGAAIELTVGAVSSGLTLRASRQIASLDDRLSDRS